MDFSQILNSAGSSFLSGITQQAGDALSKAIFGRSDRISNRDYQFYQDLADSGNPREINRQRDFLEGLAPSQANAYNTYQDATYGADTQRQADRVKTMSSELGMSPWEITGSSGAAPLPSPSLNSPQNGSGNFMAQMVPLKVAEMSNKTALETAKIAAATTLKKTEMDNQTAVANTTASNDTSRAIANLQTANGQVPITELQVKAAQVALNMAQESNLNTATSILYNTDRLNTIRTLGELASKTIINLPGYERQTNNQYKDLINLYNVMSDGQNGENNLKDYLAKLPANEWQGVKQDMQQISRLALDAVRDAGTGLGQMASQFLGGLTNPKRKR